MLKNFSIDKLIIFAMVLMPLLAPVRADLGWLNATPITLKTVWGLVCVLAAMIWWLYEQHKFKRIRVVKSTLYYPIFLFVAWPYFTLIWVEDGYLAIKMLVAFTTIAFGFFLVVNTFDYKRSIDLALKGLVLSMSIVSIIGLIQFYMADDYFIQNIFPQFAPPSSTFGNKNMAAHFLVMTLPLAFAYTLLAKTRVSVIVMAFASFVGLWYIMYIAARQAYLAMFIEILILIIFLTIDKIKNNKHSFIYKEPYIKFKGLISFFVLLLLIFVSYLDKDGWNFNSSKKLDRIEMISMEGGSSRFPAWVNTIELIKDNPVTGVGVGQWPQSYPMYYDKVMKDVIFNEKIRLRRLHNDYLEIFANFGVIGFLLLVWLLFLTVNRIKATLINVHNMYRLQVLGVSMGLVGFSTVAMFSYPVRAFLPIYLVLTYIAIIHIANQGCYKNYLNVTSIKTVIISRFLVLIFVLLGVYFSVQSVRWVLAENHYFNAQSLMSRGNHKMAINAAQQAIRKNPWPSQYYSIAGSNLLLYGEQTLNVSYIQQAILFIKKSINISPFNTPALLQLSQAYRFLDQKKYSKM